jgi:hypothetical protein
VENNLLIDSGGKKMKAKHHFCLLSIAVILAGLLFPAHAAHALTAGETYTITIQKLNSDGSLSNVGSSASATANSSGKVSFSLAGIPDNSTCNFLVITIKDSQDNVVRKGIAPCPNAGDTLPVGVSSLTNAQTDALLTAIASAGTDDPILAVFGFAIVRSSTISSSELSFVAGMANQAINGTNGYVDYLLNNGVSSSQIADYRKIIVRKLADTSTGYSKLMKDAVDASGTAAKLNARGEAASKLLRVLVTASTDAGFSQDRVIEAFNAMGAIIVPLMTQAVGNGTLSSTTQKIIDSSIGGGIQRLKADRDIEKYSQALTTLGASGTDLNNYQSAANILMNTMTSVFKTFEQVFDGNETASDIQTAQSVFDTAMQNAFDQFQTDTAVSNARINTMISNIESALGMNPGSSGLSPNDFLYYKSDGTPVNWPVTMVILMDWISNTVSNGGSISYTRDTTAIPSTVTWLGSCSVNGYHDQADCTSNGGIWTSQRTDFAAQGMPSICATIFGIQEDIWILESVRWAAQAAAGNNMSAMEIAEKNFANSVASLAGNISGTTDGSTPLSSTIKSAIVTLLKSPQF